MPFEVVTVTVGRSSTALWEEAVGEGDKERGGWSKGLVEVWQGFAFLASRKGQFTLKGEVTCRPSSLRTSIDGSGK